MRIYLLRHAVAVERGTPGYANDDRPLTQDGIAKMKKAAKGIAQSIENVDLIMTSPLRRALETAKLVAAEYQCFDRIKATQSLLPGGDVKKLFEELARNKLREDVVLVGHNPGLGDIAAQLLGSSALLLEFKKGGICRIDIDDVTARHPGRLQWLLTSRQLRAMAKQK
jgi:phosphohistidine phosphatase